MIPHIDDALSKYDVPLSIRRQIGERLRDTKSGKARRNEARSAMDAHRGEYYHLYSGI